MALRFLLASTLALASCAKPTDHRLVVRHRHHEVPRGFLHHGNPPASTILDLRIALKANNMEGLQQVLEAVSTPGNPQYGKHLDQEELEAYVTPTSETRELVLEWLVSHGVEAEPCGSAGDWFKFQLDISTANKIFDAEFLVFTHEQSGVQYIRTLSYALPQYLHDRIDVVHPTTAFPDSAASNVLTLSGISPRDAPSSDSCSDPFATPECLQDLYGIPAAPAEVSSNLIAVTAFAQQHAQQDDLEEFLEQFRPDMNAKTLFQVETLDGGNNTQGAQEKFTFEANADIQYTLGLANTETKLISVGSQNNDKARGFLDLIEYIKNQTPESRPHVLVNNYGFNEFNVPLEIAHKLCDGYMQLGVLGVSVIVSAGDGGVAGHTSESCSNFVAAFPASCPWVTAVGSTTGIHPETADNSSAGGFSNFFGIPPYQASHVSKYLDALGDTYSGRFNKSGRGYPDVAAKGRAKVVDNGSVVNAIGSSIAAPIFGSTVARLSAARVAAGQQRLGFLNYMLYSAGASALTDITSGSNPGCDTDGFPAKEGWDPVTGLGTPRYPDLLKAVGLGS